MLKLSSIFKKQKEETNLHLPILPIIKPIKWKLLININPSESDFKEAWKLIFDYYPNECELLMISDDGINAGFTVKTPSGNHCHGGFGEYTDTPLLDNNTSVWYNYGITWGVDKNGNRFHKIDRQTWLPVNWEKVKAIETIKAFFRNLHQYPASASCGSTGGTSAPAISSINI